MYTSCQLSFVSRTDKVTTSKLKSEPHSSAQHKTMFTGIVEQIGTVSEYSEYDASHSGGGGVSVTVTNASPILGDCHIGDSIAINGICLTVTEYSADLSLIHI